MAAKLSPNRRPASALRAFIAGESAGGILLMGAAALALLLANSPFSAAYFELIHYQTGPVLTEKLGPMSLYLWVNDGLMAVFFLLVGLDIKREFVDGRLATWNQRRLPMVAAAGGMAVPALVYLAIVSGDPALSHGWAIPAATDIAFAIGVLALLGPRAPTSLKLFLITVAIVDDMGAVVIIALFYTAKIDVTALAAAFILFGAMLALGRAGVKRLLPFVLLAALMWFAMLLSGVHATIAGVLAAMAIPIEKTPGTPDSTTSPLHRLEHALHPWVAFGIVPLFGFANAGVNVGGLTIAQIFSPLPVGIALGLFLGKQIGIFGAVWLAVRSGFAGKLRGATWLQIYAVSVLCGIGFTMSLFIGGLAFTDPLLIEEAKIGTLMGSIASAILGYSILRMAPLHRNHDREERAATAAIGRDSDRLGNEERTSV